MDAILKVVLRNLSESTTELYPEFRYVFAKVAYEPFIKVRKTITENHIGKNISYDDTIMKILYIRDYTTKKFHLFFCNPFTNIDYTSEELKKVCFSHIDCSPYTDENGLILAGHEIALQNIFRQHLEKLFRYYKSNDSFHGYTPTMSAETHVMWNAIAKLTNLVDMYTKQTLKN